MITVRSIARQLRLSPATVSNALSGRGRVSPETAERVRAAAEAAGYRQNPLMANLMAELRRSRNDTFRGVLAAVELLEPSRSPHGIFHCELVIGARTRAAQLGFELTEFAIGTNGLSVPRLDLVLRARGIHGIVLLPSWHEPDWTQLDWTRYAGVYTDYNVGHPVLHTVCCNHYRSMMVTLAMLLERGYQRPGLFLERQRNDRIHHRWGAAFHAFHESVGTTTPVPPLFTDDLKRETFTRWFKKHRPDVVISHYTDTIDWMQSCGAHVPETHGFVCLNLLYKDRPCAGLDQQPRELGARSAEMVIAQLQRNERGVPEWPTTTTIPARWVEGPTLLPPPAKSQPESPSALVLEK